MYAAKSSLFQNFNECITQKHYFYMKIHGFSSWHPYRGSTIWPSNSLVKTATPLHILIRVCVDFWSPNTRILECMQWNHNFFTELNDPDLRSAIWPSNSLDKTATPILILDRDVDSWDSKSKIFECMQRNLHFFISLTNVSCKSITFSWKSIDSQVATPIEDLRSDP